MVWRSDGPQGLESAKVRLDLVHYMHGVVLDLGCGPEKVFPAKNIIGVDDDRDRNIFGIVANPDVQADCTKLPFVDGYADTIFSSHLLEHIVDYKAALAEWWRVLKVGGYLILYLPHADHYPNIGMPGSNPDHKHDFRNEDITDVMLNIGGWELLEDEVRTEGFEYSFLQIYRKRSFGLVERVAKKPLPEKRLAIVRLGAYGDALWVSALLPGLKKQDWHITVYTQPTGEAALRHDPNIDRMMVQPEGIFGSHGDAMPWQVAYWLHEEKKYDRFINLTGCVETQLLPKTTDHAFYFPKEQRHRLMNRNYIQELHAWADVPFDAKTVRVKFYPSAEEMHWALNERAKFPGPVVVINPTGSSLQKFYPHTQKLMELLDAAGVYSVVVGDRRQIMLEPPPRGFLVWKDWDIRKAFTFAKLADVVVGTESAVINSVSYEESVFKIVILSHSSHENLTRDWKNAAYVAQPELPCYPCHRIHDDATHCPMPQGHALCHGIPPELIAEECLNWIRKERKDAA